ncbi:MAG: hypothetical protein ABI867_41110 [Kofleriaceae bacterium]
MKILLALLAFILVIPTALADRAEPEARATVASISAKREKIVKVATDLRALVAKPPAEKLSADHQKVYDEFVKTARDTAAGCDALASKLAEGLKTQKTQKDLDSLSEMGEMESLRLQMAMDRMSKMMSTLSNLLKKISDTAQSITQNLK